MLHVVWFCQEAAEQSIQKLSFYVKESLEEHWLLRSSGCNNYANCA